MIRLIMREINHFLAKFFDEAYELGYDDGLEERYTKPPAPKCPKCRYPWGLMYFTSSCDGHRITQCPNCGWWTQSEKYMKANEMVRDTPDEENDDDD